MAFSQDLLTDPCSSQDKMPVLQFRSLRAIFCLLLGIAMSGCATHNACSEARKYPVDLAASTNCVVDFGADSGQVNFAAMGALGNVQLAIHRATKGLYVRDSDYQRREREARLSGMRWGAYHFGMPCMSEAEAVQQADVYLAELRRVARANHTENAPILLVLDVENAGNGGRMNLNYAAAFLQHIADETGKYPGFYTNPCQMMGAFSGISDRTANILRQCWLWPSCYSYRPVALPLWDRWTFWQYTGDVGGHSRMNEVHTALPVSNGFSPEVAGFHRSDRGRLLNGVPVYDSADRSLFNGSPADFETFWTLHAVTLFGQSPAMAMAH